MKLQQKIQHRLIQKGLRLLRKFGLVKDSSFKTGKNYDFLEISYFPRILSKLKIR